MRIALAGDLALAALWSHRFRSVLTVLGIVVGISTVVTVAALLAGLRLSIVVFFEEMGPDNIFLYRTSGDPNNSFPPPRELRRRPVLPEYAELFRSLCPSVQDSSVTLFVPPVIEGRPITARVRGRESDSLLVAGFSANHFAIAPRELSSGRVFAEEEERRGARVALLGADIALALFPDGRAAGRRVLVDGAEYTVLGVFGKAKGSFFGDNSADRQVAIPLRTARSRYPALDRFLITSRARPGLRREAYEEVETILRKVRRTVGENDFSLSTPEQVIREFDSMTRMVVLVSLAISGLGLLVGGIGVMNIMLVSVTERTLEIGIRKALGARRRDIVAQFLLEALALTGTGGVAGVAASILLTALVVRLAPWLKSEVPPAAVAVGLAVSVLVGLFFGVWPAVKAARLDPGEALRYE